MREEEISWLSWDADDVSTLLDMAATGDVFVKVTRTKVPARRLKVYVGIAAARPAG